MVLSKDIKLAVCFGLIVGALISICNLCFASELENVDFQVLNNANIGSNGDIVSYNGFYVYYFEIEEGYEYYLTPTYSRYCGVSNVEPYVGLILDEYSIYNGGETYTFSGRGYVYVSIAGANLSSPGTLQRKKLEGLTDFVDNISFALSFDNLSSIWVLVVPIIAISVLVGLGFYLVKRVIIKMKKAKGGI